MPAEPRPKLLVQSLALRLGGVCFCVGLAWNLRAPCPQTAPARRTARCNRRSRAAPRGPEWPAMLAPGYGAVIRAISAKAPRWANKTALRGGEAGAAGVLLPARPACFRWCGGRAFAGSAGVLSLVRRACFRRARQTACASRRDQGTLPGHGWAQRAAVHDLQRLVRVDFRHRGRGDRWGGYPNVGDRHWPRGLPAALRRGVRQCGRVANRAGPAPHALRRRARARREQASAGSRRRGRDAHRARGSPRGRVSHGGRRRTKRARGVRRSARGRAAAEDRRSTGAGAGLGPRVAGEDPPGPDRVRAVLERVRVAVLPGRDRQWLDLRDPVLAHLRGSRCVPGVQRDPALALAPQARAGRSTPSRRTWARSSVSTSSKGGRRESTASG